MHFLNCIFAVLVITVGTLGYAKRIEQNTLQGDRIPQSYQPVPNPLPEGGRTKSDYGKGWKFLGTMIVGERHFAITSQTESIWDGKPCHWLEIPGEKDGVSPVEVKIDPFRSVITRVVYQTRKEI